MTTNTPTLGDLLREAINRNVVAHAQERQAKLDKERGERERAETLLRALFDNAKHVFTSAILAGNAIVPIRVGGGVNVEVSELTNKSSFDIDRPSHEYFSFWKDFSDWAESQGLEARWQFQDDGFGEVNWRLLSVQPLAKIAND